MAHVVGHLGLPGEEDLAADPELDPNIRIGKLGVERVYDEWLRGIPGEIAYRVNRRSEVLDERPEVPARQGNTVYLTLDEELQVLVETALAEGIELSNRLKAEQRQRGDSEGARNQTVRGAAVVLDARTFEVLALSSLPSFDPQLFVSGLDPNTYAELQEQGAFLNLAVSGLYPPASTFKAVTYVTALEEGVPLPNGVEGTDPTSGLVHCDGQLQLPGFDPGSPQTFRDWYHPRNLGWLDLHGALEHSCNIYFYNIALGVWQNWKETPRENVIQDWARRLGYGSPTGIDLTGEQAGTIPDRALFEEWKQYTLDNPDRTPLIDRDRLELESPWLGGDLMNTAIGQGSVAATPLQVAVSYAAVANGGQLMTPYVVREVRDRDGNVVIVNQPELVAEVPIEPATVQSFLTDLNRVVTSGTAAAAFRDFGDSLYRVGGKTGTGQSGRSRDNHAWFAGVAPVDNPRWVVAVVIDQGGSGGAVAAPVARHIMQYLMGEQPTPITPGAVTD
jgi:penicillin-binding protein 2